MASVAIVLGSVRPGRAGEQVVRWIEEQARQLDGVSTVFFDLRDYQLPLFAEEMPPSMQAPELPEAVRLRTNIEANDAVLFVTPEYNVQPFGVRGSEERYRLPAPGHAQGQGCWSRRLLVVRRCQASRAPARDPVDLRCRRSRPAGWHQPWF